MAFPSMTSSSSSTRMRTETLPSSPLFAPGIALMPAEFPERLASLKGAAGLSWEGFAACLGVDSRQVLRWRQGAVPCGGAMLAICRLAAAVPGGLGALLGDQPIRPDAHDGSRPSDSPVPDVMVLMPADFPERPLALKDITGLSWEGLSICLGVDCRQVLRWRQGAEPCGGAMLAICRLAAMVPRGLGVLLNDETLGSRVDKHRRDGGQ